MNETLRAFVAETETGFHGRMKSVRQLVHRSIRPDEYFDAAVIGGYSIADILGGRVSEQEIDPEVIKAFHLQYPNAGTFVEFVRSHSGNEFALAGALNGVKGKLFELEYVDWLNHGHLPEGATATLANSPTQEGWDIEIRSHDGQIVEQLQLKATESLGYIKNALQNHPEIDVVATHEVFDHLDGSGIAEHVIVSDLSNDALADRIQVQAEAVTAEFDLPLIAFGVIALQSCTRYWQGQMSAAEAVRQGFGRGTRSLVCRGSAYVAMIIANEPVLGLPTSVLTRLIFNRTDVQRRFVTILEEYISLLRDRRIGLTLKETIAAVAYGSIDPAGLNQSASG